MNLQQNKDSIFRSVERIAEKSNRLKNSVKIIAVTKYVDCETAR